ncbi:MAG: hypothetical protein Q4D38_11805 [Planctomycetia bacterium]|nr:hypothetical protein [Planctomycetia bacterium]
MAQDDIGNQPPSVESSIVENLNGNSEPASHAPTEPEAETEKADDAQSAQGAKEPQSSSQSDGESKKSTAADDSSQTEKSVVKDVHLVATQTLEISKEDAETATKLANDYVALVVKNTEAKTRGDFLERETKRLHSLCDANGGFRGFLADFTILDDEDYPELKGMEEPLAHFIAGEMKPLNEQMRLAVAALENQVKRDVESWRKLRQQLVEREFLLFDIESNRHIVAQLASMLSMDKRWFWLWGVLAFGALALASFHERRHEVRRWLNGGRARQMGLSKVLFGVFCLLLATTLVSFLMGDFLYKAMLDVTFSAASPHRIHTEALEKERHQVATLTKAEKSARSALEVEKDAWKSLAMKNVRQGKRIVEEWNTWRGFVEEFAVQNAVLKNVQKQMSADQKRFEEVNAALAGVSDEVLHYLRIKHLLRFGLGTFLALITFLGIACYWSDVNRRLKAIFETCPHCLGGGKLKRCDENGVDFAQGNFVKCTHLVSEEPSEECGYRFERKLRPLAKLSFPTLGIPQVGKTHWLTMLYWEVLNGYYPGLGLSCVPSSVTKEMDRRIDDIMNTRIGTAATQRDRIPLPLVLKYRDRDLLGRTELLANIFDYSGEVTTDVPLDDYRRKRALKSDGFLFFLDPTYPWKPQANALVRFRKDLKNLKGLKDNDSLHLPIAICLTKIDLLPLVTALGDSEAESEKFYAQLAEIDPTGLAMNKDIIEKRSVVTDDLRRKIWPDWDMETQIADLFGGRYRFFPLTPVGLDGVGEADLRLRTIAPFGLVEPLAWLLEMSGYPTLNNK